MNEPTPVVLYWKIAFVDDNELQPLALVDAMRSERAPELCDDDDMLVRDDRTVATLASTGELLRVDWLSGRMVAVVSHAHAQTSESPRLPMPR
eukprot:GEMP01075914.1.p1 GENE.GEMP01075914.1~~GEMP01075914.1.p1  ORF type:complete len:105 (+),score=8.63 GEMP01075914.1:39-317(+)